MYKSSVKPHYPRIRKVKTGSGSTAIQVGSYQGNRFKLSKHIGSAKDPQKISELAAMAREYIRSRSPQLEFDFNPQSAEILFKRGVRAAAGRLETAYAYLDRIYSRVGFNRLDNRTLKHFVMIRILEPASKIKSIGLLKKYFNLDYKKTTVFRELAKLPALKEKAELVAVNYARDRLGFDFRLVFYDVTTLYFETSGQDELRRNGFSKDNKINQPQILIGLVVNNTGFPVYWDIFKGNTFEGKTIIPVISAIKEKHQIGRLTVVADAGMLSAKNLAELERRGIDYVVGARIKTLKLAQAQTIADGLGKADQKIIRRGQIIYEYSAKRAGKDKADNDKQIDKTGYYLKNPSKSVRRSKFLSSAGRNTLIINEAAIKKYRLLEGIKSYQTNIRDLADRLLLDRYKDLWRVEQSFRIAKSDLEIRPVYHRRETSIRSHVLIVFMALCLSRVIELETGKSVRRVMDELKDKWTITLIDEISGNTLDVTLNTV